MGTGASNQVRADSGDAVTVVKGIENGASASAIANSSECKDVTNSKKTSDDTSEKIKEKIKSKDHEKINGQRTLPKPKTTALPQELNKTKKQSDINISKSNVISIKKDEKKINDEYQELTAKIKHLETELAKSESLHLDAADQIQMLEEKLENAYAIKSNGENKDLVETINAKDQYIVKLEKDLKTFQTEADTNKLKLKRRIRRLTNQLHEAKQDASISQMELKSEIKQLKEQLKDKGDKGQASSQKGGGDDGSHSKVIVELSNQMSEQNDRIHLLEAQLAEKESLIVALESKSSQSAQNIDEHNKSDLPKPSSDRLQSGRGSRTHKTPSTRPSSNVHRDNDTLDETLSRPSFSRMSTALSDSDSDWEVDESRPQTRSAPARVRVKSAASTQSKRSVARQAGVTPDDDSIMQYCSTHDPLEAPLHVRDAKTSEGRTHPHNRSSLKKHLDKQKHEAETNSLIGPSVAFALPQEMPSSCEPTPRYGDPRGLPGFSKLTVINTIHQ